MSGEFHHKYTLTKHRMEPPTDLYEDMSTLNALYGELCWNHDDPLEFKADFENNCIIIRNKNHGKRKDN